MNMNLKLYVISSYLKLFGQQLNFLIFHSQSEEDR